VRGERERKREGEREREEGGERERERERERREGRREGRGERERARVGGRQNTVADVWMLRFHQMRRTYLRLPHPSLQLQNQPLRSCCRQDSRTGHSTLASRKYHAPNTYTRLHEMR